MHAWAVQLYGVHVALRTCSVSWGLFRPCCSSSWPREQVGQASSASMMWAVPTTLCPAPQCQCQCGAGAVRCGAGAASPQGNGQAGNASARAGHANSYTRKSSTAALR